MPRADQDRREGLAEVGRQARGLAAVARDLPRGRAGDPAAVERERRDEVEHEQQHVGGDEEAEPQLEPCRRPGAFEPRGGPEVVGAEQRHRGQPADDDDQQRHQRAGDRDAELLTRGRGVATHLHHAAEEEEVDAADLDPLTAGGDRVAELVQQDRAEEPEGGEDGHDEARLLVAELVGERLLQPEDGQEQDQEPRDIDPDADPEDRRQADGAATEHWMSMVA